MWVGVHLRQPYRQYSSSVENFVVSIIMIQAIVIIGSNNKLEELIQGNMYDIIRIYQNKILLCIDCECGILSISSINY